MGLFNKNKVQAYDGTCLWIDNVGAPNTRLFKVYPVQSNKNDVVIDFGNNETYTIDRKYIRGKRLIIYKMSSGKIVIQDPNKWSNVDLDEEGIKELRFNLQNFGIQEGKAALHRWTMPKTAMDKLLPLFKLLFICIAVAVIGWAAIKGGTYVLDTVVKSRTMDCASIITKNLIPIGVSNSTTPLGT